MPISPLAVTPEVRVCISFMEQPGHCDDSAVSIKSAVLLYLLAHNFVRSLGTATHSSLCGQVLSTFKDWHVVDTQYCFYHAVTESVFIHKKAFYLIIITIKKSVSGCLLPVLLKSNSLQGGKGEKGH